MKVISTDGVKSVPIYDDGDWWDTVVPPYSSTRRDLLSKVAATSRARGLKSRAVSNVPFAIVRKGSDEVVDESHAWHNVLKFMPKPRDLIRRLQLSIMDNNGAYLRMGRDVLKQPKQLHYVKFDSILPVTDKVTGELLYLNRYVNGRLEKQYSPDDRTLIRMWLLDDTTELLPTDETETKSILSASGIIFYSDAFTENYYRRGGVKPTLIAMKGMVTNEKREDIQRDWTSFVRGIGRGVANIAAKIFQAEAMDIKPFGDGLGDLKETPVYRQALENIAMGYGMPLSLLLSNSANYATANTEDLQWFRNDVVPAFDFIADCLNEQVFEPLGYRLESREENTDQEQESEVSRVGALAGYGDALEKYPDAETFLSAAIGIFGFEIPDDHIAAIRRYYSSKQSKTVEIQEPVVVEEQEEQEEEVEQKWMPSLDEFKELDVWRDVALRKHRKGDTLDFEYQPHYCGLPADISESIKAALLTAQTAEEIKAAFQVPHGNIAVKSDLLVLAESINRLAEK
jgi:hypothetical protein